MRTFSAQGGGLAIAVLALATQATPAWAVGSLPGPEAGGIAGAAIIGALVVAKLWRRK